MDISFRQCHMNDLAILQDISRRTYADTFAHLNTPENMAAYLDAAYHIDKLRTELSDCHSLFYFLYADGALAGYMKLNESPAQTEIHDPESLEIQRIYVAKEYQGNRLGQFLMDQAIEIAHSRIKSYIWLGVWEKNEKALRFYQNNGFYPIGEHSFVMGTEVQTDYLLRKDL